MDSYNKFNYSSLIEKRISKLKHFSEEEKKELLKELTLSDDDLKAYKSNHKEEKSYISGNAADYISYYDNKTNEEITISKENELGPRPSVLLEDSKKKEYLIKMFLTLKKRHKNHEQEKQNYTPEQLAVVNKIEKESGGKVKCIVDTKFLKAFGKITGVDYRGAGVLGKRVIVGVPENLTRESLLRHEAIHCAQQRDIGFGKRLGISLIDSKIKQFFGPEKGTSSAVDYGTDNQVTDLETYMNQFNPNYLPNRKKNDHKKYYDKDFLKAEFKRLREDELSHMKDNLLLLENQKKSSSNIQFELDDKIKNIKQDIKQFESLLQKLKDDLEIRTVLIEPDVLPNKSDINNKNYDEKAQVWTESFTNQDKRIKFEKSLYKETMQKSKKKESELINFNGSEEEKEILEGEIEAYKVFLNNIKGDKDRSRAKAKKDRKELLEKRMQIENQKKSS